jgi:hypothetical protein
MSPRKNSLVLGLTAFLAGVAISQTVGQVTAHALAPGGDITAEGGAGGQIVLRPTASGKSYAVLVESARRGSPSRTPITFQQESLALDLSNGATARIYELRRVMECGPECKPCEPGPSDACVVPPVPLVPPPVPPPGGYQVHFLSARR